MIASPSQSIPSASSLPKDSQVILDLNRQLLESIHAGDWNTYESMVDPSVTCFEPEAVGYLVEGLPFHQFYFDHARTSASTEQPQLPPRSTMVRPHVRMLSETAAVVCYSRLTQTIGNDEENNGPVTKWCEETRVWQKSLEGTWKNVHIHRSMN